MESAWPAIRRRNGAQWRRARVRTFRTRSSMIKPLLEGKPLRLPLHTILVHAPIGLFTLSLLLDIGSHLVSFEGLYQGAFYCIVGGVATGLLAAIPGFVDY